MPNACLSLKGLKDKSLSKVKMAENGKIFIICYHILNTVEETLTYFLKLAIYNQLKGCFLL